MIYKMTMEYQTGTVTLYLEEKVMPGRWEVQELLQQAIVKQLEEGDPEFLTLLPDYCQSGGLQEWVPRVSKEKVKELLRLLKEDPEELEEETWNLAEQLLLGTLQGQALWELEQSPEELVTWEEREDLDKEDEEELLHPMLSMLLEHLPSLHWD